MRLGNGQFVTIAPPGAVSVTALGITDGGEIAGFYLDVNSVEHGFIRDAHGNYTTVNDPDAAAAPGVGTVLTAIQFSGTVTGSFKDATTFTDRGFVLNQFGAFTNFDAPDAGSCVGCGTYPLAINALGEITGYYVDNNSLQHSFLRDNLGNITEFSMPGSFLTEAVSTNNFGETVGQWLNSQAVTLGFTRDSSGALNGFSAPGQNVATVPTANNDGGQIIGFSIDQHAVKHGFVQ